MFYNKKEANIQKLIILEKKKIEFDSNYSNKKLLELEEKKKKVEIDCQKKLNPKVKGLTKVILIYKYLLIFKNDDFPSLYAYVIFDDLNVRNSVYHQYSIIY